MLILSLRMAIPELCRFHGIIIRMYSEDHPPPHFHVEYSGREAQVRIEPIHVLQGRLPPRIPRLIIGWASIHQE